MKKSTKQKEIQFDNMETLSKKISIVTTYAFLIKNKSLLNKKSLSHNKTNSKIYTTTSNLTSICHSLLSRWIIGSSIYGWEHWDV
jgi:predicted transporter